MPIARTITALALAAASSMLAGCREGSGTTAPADTPRIELKASVAPIEGTVVSSPTDGRVAEVRVQEGSAVHAGDVLLTLTNPGVDRDLAYARAAVTAAEARIRSADRTPRPKNDDALAAAAEVLRTRQAKVDRYRALLASGDVSRQELLDVESELAVAKRDWVAARDRSVETAPATDPALLRADLDRARSDETFALHRQSLLTITASASGTIGQLKVHPGDDVYTRDRLAEIVDPATVRVQAQVAPELLRFLHPGLPVDVKLLTIPPRTYRQPIAHVTATAAEGGAGLDVIVPNPDRLLRPGTPALITVP